MTERRHHLSSITIVVRDYDEAIAFYRDKLNFLLVEDTEIDEKKRWVVMSPSGSPETQLLLAKASNAEQQARIGNQTGGRVAFFLHTDDFHRDYQSMLSAGVEFIEQPREEIYGTVAVFKDLYGNKWDFIEPK